MLPTSSINGAESWEARILLRHSAGHLWQTAGCVIVKEADLASRSAARASYTLYCAIDTGTNSFARSSAAIVAMACKETRVLHFLHCSITLL